MRSSNGRERSQEKFFVQWSSVEQSGYSMCSDHDLLSPGQTIMATSQRNTSKHYSAHHVVCVWPPLCDVLQHVECCWLKFDFSNLSQQHPTCRNMSQHDGQTIATCCAQQCCDRLARAFTHRLICYPAHLKFIDPKCLMISW